MRALVIVPAFNEALNLPTVVSELRAAVPDCDICVVDDGSSDSTAAVAKASGATVVLRLPANLGIGGAVQAGYLWAYSHQYDVAVQIDGDGQHDPRFIPQGIEPIAAGRADLVIGSRFLTPSGGFRSTAARRAGIRYLALFLRSRCGVVVTDPTSGFRVAGPRALALFARSYPTDYPEPEAIALAHRSGLRVREFAVTMGAREHGTSSIHFGRAIYYFVKVSLALIILPHRATTRRLTPASTD